MGLSGVLLQVLRQWAYLVCCWCHGDEPTRRVVADVRVINLSDLLLQVSSRWTHLTWCCSYHDLLLQMSRLDVAGVKAFCCRCQADGPT